MSSKWSFFDDDTTSADFVNIESAEPLLEKNDGKNSAPKTICDVVVETIREDRSFKQRQNWPLVGLSDVKKLNRNLIGKPFGNFPTIAAHKGWNSNEVKSVDYENDSWSLFDKDTNKYKYDNYNEEIKFLKLLFTEIPDGVVLAGGFLVKFLVASKRSVRRDGITDLDLFLVGNGISPSETFVKTVRLINTLYGDRVRWSRNKYVVNALICHDRMSPTMVQIITKQFKSKDLVIGNFDLAASSVVFDGQLLLFTPMAALTYATQTIYVDTQRKSLAFEYRLQKYNRKGFKLCFPELDFDSIKIDCQILRQVDFKLGKMKLRKLDNGVDRKLSLSGTSDGNNEVSTYGGAFVNSKALIKVLLKGTIDEKLYVAMDIDMNGLMSNYRISGNTDLQRLYAPLIPDVYTGPITHLRTWYNEKGFEALISTFTERDDTKRVNLQREIRTAFVQQLQNRVQKICANYGPQVEFFENVDPFRPDPIPGKQFYDKYYKDVGLELSSDAHVPEAEVVGIAKEIEKPDAESSCKTS